VTLLSSLLDVPVQLALLLSLAASTAGHDAPGANVVESTPATVSFVSEPLEGPLLFGERAWLRAVKAASGDAMVAEYAGRIFKTSGGRFYIPATDERRRILDARRDATLAERVARAYAETNAREMHAVLRREATAGDLYIAHLYGPEAAIALLKAAAEAPDALALERFPLLASDVAPSTGPSARTLTVGQLYGRLTAALREPPRLVAIGLKPSVADAPKPVVGASDAGAETIAWHTEVNVPETSGVRQ
jgi:hypothetical protein